MSSILRTGFYPFWFWNGDLTEAEVRRQIREMAEQGIRGFYVHSRQGLHQPYLSDAFFEMIGVALDEAKRHEMELHLYDEYPYPSGVAGGAVVQGDPEFLATELLQQSFDCEGGPLRLELPAGRVLCCTAYPVDDAGGVRWDAARDLLSAVGMVLTAESYNETGLTSYNRKRYFASRPKPVLEADLPPGRWRVYVSAQARVQTHKYWTDFVDVLNPEAVRRFIELTHAEYHRRFGEEFGTAIPSIFTDETTPHWSTRLPAEFRARRGYDLLPLLPALQDPTHPEHLRVARDLSDVRYELFCETFERPMQEWCEEHGIWYAAEKNILRLGQLNYMHLPGCEPGHAKAGAKPDLLEARLRDNARAVASAAWFYGKPGSVCECYHSLGWSGTLQDARLIAEGLLLMGITGIVPHGFFYTTHALAKHDAPPSFFFQMPYWPLFHLLSERVDRIGRRFEGTRIDAQVLVVDPTPGLPTEEGRAAFERIMDGLMAAHIDWLMVDTDILESGEIARGCVRIRGISVSTIVVPPMQGVEPALEQWLSLFAGAGGNVVRCDVNVDPARLICELGVAPSCGMSCIEGDASAVQMVTRTDGERRCWLFLNTGRKPVRLALTDDVPLAEIPLDDTSGPRLRAAVGRPEIQLAPFDSALIEETDEAALAEGPPVVHLHLPERLKITLGGPNLLRMAEWGMRLIDEKGRPGPTTGVPAVPIANQLKRSGLPFAPRICGHFGREPDLHLPELRVRYRFDFETEFTGDVDLVMEPGSIKGKWQITVNAGTRLAAADFAPTGALVRGCLGCSIGEALQPGRNSIEVEVVTDRLDGGLRNPLYLAGPFGLSLNPVMLTNPVSEGAFEEHEANGLPFYAGTVDYEATVDIAELPEAGRILVSFELPDGFADACAVALNGGPFHPMPWSPRRVLVDAAELHAGGNELRLRVYTTLIRAFEGEFFDYESHAHRPVGEC